MFWRLHPQPLSPMNAQLQSYLNSEIQIIVAVYPHQRSFFLKKVINMGSHNETLYRESNTSEISAPNGVSVELSLPQGLGSRRKKRQEDCKSQKWWTFQYNKSDIHLIQSLRQYLRDLHRLKPDKIPGWRREVDTVLPLTKKLFSTATCREREKSVFFNEVSITGYSIHSLGQAQCPA